MHIIVCFCTTPFKIKGKTHSISTYIGHVITSDLYIQSKFCFWKINNVERRVLKRIRSYFIIVRTQTHAQCADVKSFFCDLPQNKKKKKKKKTFLSLFYMKAKEEKRLKRSRNLRSLRCTTFLLILRNIAKCRLKIFSLKVKKFLPIESKCLLFAEIIRKFLLKERKFTLEKKKSYLYFKTFLC